MRERVRFLFQLRHRWLKAGKKVLFIDADLRKSVLAGRHRVQGELKGLSHFLSGRAKVEDVVCKTQIEGLMVIFAGIIPPNPAELLGQERFGINLQRKKGV